MLELLLNQNLLFGLIGGLGLFLFGMKIMSEGLQKVAGDRMRKILGALTSNRVVGTLVGLAVTAIIQSSSATTVMVVGFVNAGLMSLMQAIGVVLGANIGTTVTAQLIAFKITQYALPAIGLGAGLKLFARGRRLQYMGEIILGFGILFFGLSTMKHAFDPVKSSEAFKAIFTYFGSSHLLAVLVGAVLTVIVQSSSATIGVTLALASSGLLTFEASVALILGENIGTTITANLAAIGTNIAARRTALAHFLFNAIGVAYMLALLPWFVQFISAITPGDADFVIRTADEAARYGLSVGDKPYIARHIANTHTMFNIVNTLIFLPLIGLLARLSTALVPGEDAAMEFHLKYIDNRVLNTPPIALEQARSETRRMGEICCEMLDDCLVYLREPDDRKIPFLEQKEDLLDVLQKEITTFLVAVSQKSISAEISKEIRSVMRMVNNFERIGDYCENLWELGQRKRDQKVEYSDVGTTELAEMEERTREFLFFVVSALKEDDRTILPEAKKREKALNIMEETLRNNHSERLNRGECKVNSGLIFLDMVHNFEKIGDHSFNIAEAVVGKK